MKKHNFFSFLFIVYVVLTAVSTGYAFNKKVIDAVNAVVRGNPTPEQEMIAIYNNKEINLMGINANESQGGISREVYNAYQKWFHENHTPRIKEAIRKAGFNTELPENASLNPGADIDVPVNAPEGQSITLDDIKRIEKIYKQELANYFRQKGLNPPAEPDIDIDFLGNPNQMTPEEFKKMAEYINQRGGTAYTDPNAARAQLKLQEGKVPTIEESMAYQREMERLAIKKLETGAKLRAEARKAFRSGNRTKGIDLTSEARLQEYQAGKYVRRMRKCDNALRKKYGLKAKEPTALEKDLEIIAAEGRGAAKSTRALTNSRLRIERMIEIISEDSAETVANAIAKKFISNHPEFAKMDWNKFQKLVQNEKMNLLRYKGNTEKLNKEVEGMIKRLHAPEAPTKGITAAGENIAEGMEATSIWQKDITRPTFKVLRVTMMLGMAVLTGHSGVEYTLKHDVDPTDTELTFLAKCIKNSLWYGTGLGFAADEAIKDQVELYRKALERGEDPSLRKHMTLMYLRTATYFGRDAIIGLMLLPDTVVEYFTEKKKWKHYVEAQNELVSIMK